MKDITKFCMESDWRHIALLVLNGSGFLLFFLPSNTEEERGLIMGYAITYFFASAFWTALLTSIPPPKKTKDQTS